MTVLHDTLTRAEFDRIRGSGPSVARSPSAEANSHAEGIGHSNLNTSSRSLRSLASGSGESISTETDVRRCKGCDTALPAGADGRKRFCSNSCRIRSGRKVNERTKSAVGSVQSTIDPATSRQDGSERRGSNEEDGVVDLVSRLLGLGEVAEIQIRLGSTVLVVRGA
jgi:hypothetical protein